MDLVLEAAGQVVQTIVGSTIGAFAGATFAWWYNRKAAREAELRKWQGERLNEFLNSAARISPQIEQLLASLARGGDRQEAERALEQVRLFNSISIASVAKESVEVGSAIQSVTNAKLTLTAAVRSALADHENRVRVDQFAKEFAVLEQAVTTFDRAAMRYLFGWQQKG